MATATAVRVTAETTTRKKVSVPIANNPFDPAGISVGDGVVTVTRPIGQVHRLFEALRNEASSWYVVKHTPEELKKLSKHDARRKAKGKDVRPRHIEGGYILLGGKARYHRLTSGMSVENVYKEFLYLKNESLYWAKAAGVHQQTLLDSLADSED